MIKKDLVATTNRKTNLLLVHLLNYVEDVNVRYHYISIATFIFVVSG